MTPPRLAQDRRHEVVPHTPHDALLGVVEEDTVAEVLWEGTAAGSEGGRGRGLSGKRARVASIFAAKSACKYSGGGGRWIRDTWLLTPAASTTPATQKNLMPLCADWGAQVAPV